MRFGLSGSAGGLDSVGTSPVTHAPLVERLGFDCMWFNEEHFEHSLTSGSRQVMSSIPLATAVATATTTLRVGFSVILVPLHQPLRLAEEIATLDVLSGGRVNFGLSRAQNTRYAQAFGYDPADGPTLAQCLDDILGWWSGTPLTIEGEDHLVTPDVVQRPHPPVFVAAYSEETIAWAAERGYPIMQHGIQSPASVDRCLRSYAGHGGDVSHVPVGRFCYVAESDEQARREAGEVVEQQARRLYDIGIWRKRGGEVMTEADLEPERFYHETAIVGGPETVAARIADLRDTYGVRYVNLLSSFFGFLPEDLLLRSLELFSTEVMPRLGGRS